MTELNISQLGWLLGIVGIAFGIWGQARSGRKDNDADAKERGAILTKLDFMSSQMNGLQAQMTGFNTCLVDVATRLGAVEKSSERAHVRIDKHEQATRAQVDEP